MSKKRSIFEEVQSETRVEAAQPGLIDRGRGGARRGIRIWLIMLFALVCVMIAVGGLTRLTDSGLSITEWRPLTGAIPPLTPEDWEAEFALYQQIDEFRIQNQWMTMADFKVIYWWEWGHRQLGRVIGLVWAVGFLGFLAARKIPAGDPSGPGLHHSGLHRLVCPFAGARGTRPDAGPSRARRRAIRHGHGADAFRLPANPAGGIGRGH